MTRVGPGLLLLALPLAAPAPLAAQARRGPIESREEWLLAQPVLGLPACSPDALPAGRTDVRVDLDWGNDFTWEAGPGGREADLRFLIDGEHRAAALTVRRGLGGGWTAGLRLPVRWRGGGRLDGIIDPFHNWFGFPDSGRPLFPRDRLRVEGRRATGQPLVWTGTEGAGLGSLEAELHRALREPPGRHGWAVSVVTRLALPAGTGPFRDAGVAAGAQVVAACDWGSRADLFFGAGGTAASRDEREGVRYRPVRLHGFVALELRPVRGWSFLVQADLASRLVEGLERLPGRHGYLRIGSKVGIGRSWTIEAGFTEGIVDLETTTDFGVFAGLSRRF